MRKLCWSHATAGIPVVEPEGEFPSQSYWWSMGIPIDEPELCQSHCQSCVRAIIRAALELRNYGQHMIYFDRVLGNKIWHLVQQPGRVVTRNGGRQGGWVSPSPQPAQSTYEAPFSSNMLCLGYYITEEFYNIVNKSIENNMNLCVLGRCISKKKRKGIFDEIIMNS